MSHSSRYGSLKRRFGKLMCSLTPDFCQEDRRAIKRKKMAGERQASRLEAMKIVPEAMSDLYPARCPDCGATDCPYVSTEWSSDRICDPLFDVSWA